MQISIGKNATATIISAYAPTMTNPEETKDKFYEELDLLVASTKSVKLILLGDFNARVGSDYHAWYRVLGKHGIGKSNSNGHLLLRMCAAHDLAITNTIFRIPTRNKTTWMHPRSKNWHLIDYVIVRAKNRQDVKVTKAMCGADCWTDHRLIISKLNFHIQPKRRPQGQKIQKKLNVNILKDAQKEQDLQKHMQDKLEGLQHHQPNIEDMWSSFRDTVHSIATERLSPVTRYHQDWFDENDPEIQMLLQEKHHLLRAHQNDPSCEAKRTAFNNIRSKMQSKLRHARLLA